MLFNLHNGLQSPCKETVLYIVKGSYEYYHYQCDDVNDVGWGCAYRTLQTICSWINQNTGINTTIPSLSKIQKTLVDIGDKSCDFVGSKQWIGSFEICLYLDHQYNIPCKILHCRNGNEVASSFEDLVSHFNNYGSPCMIGGDSDAASKTLLGVSREGSRRFYLIMDPHFSGEADIKYLQQNGWIEWKDESIFSPESFYNFCLPLCKPV